MRKLSPENKSQYLSSALDKIEAHYDGGEWDFYELSNGGYFMAPNSREHYRISVQGNYFDGLLSAEAAGMVATSFVLAQLANSNLPFQKDAVLIIISCLITPAGIKNMRSSVLPSIK